MDKLTKEQRDAGLSRWVEVFREHNIGQAEFAKRMGVSRQTAARWGSPSTRGAPIVPIMEFCQAHDVSIIWLTHGIGPKTMSELKRLISLGELSESRETAKARMQENTELMNAAATTITKLSQALARAKHTTDL